MLYAGTPQNKLSGCNRLLLQSAAMCDVTLAVVLQVPGEMFALALEAKARDMGVVGSTQNILDFISGKLAEALERPFPERLQVRHVNQDWACGLPLRLSLVGLGAGGTAEAACQHSAGTKSVPCCACFWKYGNAFCKYVAFWLVQYHQSINILFVLNV